MKGWCLTLVALTAALTSCGPKSAPKPVAKLIEPSPSPDAVWPWKDAQKEDLHKGITRWRNEKTADGTVLDLYQFDFKTNPKLRFEIYDQDEDDAKPFDNEADYFPNGVGQVVRHLNQRQSGMVLVAWNGLFFAYDRGPKTPSRGFAKHIGPVVLRSKAYHNVGKYRWTFGVKFVDGKPSFRVRHEPPFKSLPGLFDFASTGAQCLILNGVPLRLAAIDEKPHPSTPTDVGTIALVDHMRTSRTSMAWSKDVRYFYLLVVDEPDSETASKLALKRGESPTGGWTLADLQRFWIAIGAWGAVNSDGGSVTQLASIDPEGGYEVLPPRIVSSERRIHLDKDLKDAPEGGTLLTFYITESR